MKGNREFRRGWRAGGPAFLSIIVLTVLTACGSSGAPSGGTKGPNTAVTVLWQPSFGSAGFVYAGQKHIWSSYGLSVSGIKVQSGPAAFGVLASQSVSFAQIGMVPAITALAKGVNYDILYVANDTSVLEGVYVNPTLKMGGISALVGKRIGVPKGSTAEVGMRLALAKKGVAATSVEFVYLQPPAIMAAYQRGQIDGAWLWDTPAVQLMNEGAIPLATESSLGIHLPNLWLVNRTYEAAHPGVVAQFVAALNASAIAINKDPAVVAPLLAADLGVTNTQMLTVVKAERLAKTTDMLDPASSASFVSASGIAQQLQLAETELLAEGSIPKAIDIKSLLAVNALRASQSVQGR